MADQIELFSPEIDLGDPIGSKAPTADGVNLAHRLPSALRLGTSSWTFPGWAGVVYRQRASEQMLAQQGLKHYARHPLLRSVGVDRTFYRPAPESEFQKWALAVPEDFRFLVKAHAALTTPADLVPSVPAAATTVSRYLDADYATEHVIAPAVAGLGSRLGVILFQFPPLGLRHTHDPVQFAQALSGFLGRLPKGPQYAVEIRNRELLNAFYADALAVNGVTHCFNVHPKMPDVLEQARILGEHALCGSTVAIRWMLHPTHAYEVARARYFPFDRLVDPDLRSRLSIAELVSRLVARDKELIVIANNKAEGSAPLSLWSLAGEIVRQSEEEESER
jgi:uncharacterized protein YecE (DUF72 family)